MSRRQFEEWQAFYRLDPWGGERDDLNAGIIASTIAASQGVNMRPSEIMPDWLGTEDRKTLDTKEEHEAKMDALFSRLRAMRGSDDRQHGNQDKRPDGSAAP